VNVIVWLLLVAQARAWAVARSVAIRRAAASSRIRTSVSAYLGTAAAVRMPRTSTTITIST